MTKQAKKKKKATNLLVTNSEGGKKKQLTIPNSKLTCSSERNLDLFTYPNIISINVGAQRISYIFWS